MAKVDCGVPMGDTRRTNFVVAPQGEYTLAIESIEQKIGKSSNEPYLDVKYRVIEASNVANKPYTGGEVGDMISLKRKPDGTLVADWKVACWLDSIHGVKFEGKDFDTDTFIGKHVLVNLDIEQGQSTSGSSFERNRVNKYKLPGGVTAPSSSGTQSPPTDGGAPVDM